MPQPRVIPGFYFDVEKGKYFKISTTHSAPPSQAKYTLQNVRKEQRKAAAEKFARKQQEKRDQETVVRPHTRKNWGLQMAGLDREIGSRRKTYYTQSIWPSACVAGMDTMKTVVEKPVHSVIRFFDLDPHTKTIYAVHADNAISRRRRNPPSSIPSSGSDLDQDMEAGCLPDGMPVGSSFAESLGEYSFEPWDMLARLTSSISSLTYLPSSKALAATTYGSDRAPTVYLSDPDVDGPYVNQQFTPRSCSTIWGAAAPPVSASPGSVPRSGTESLAVAAASSLMLLERSPAGDWNSSIALQSDSDMLALDWLSPTTVVLGQRSGKILLYDTRSRGHSHILTNPFPITKLKRADDPTRLVCAGLQNGLFVYDIRSRDTFSKKARGHYNDKFFNDVYPGTENRHKRKKMKFTVAPNWSQPILSFPYDNIDDHYLDMAVQPNLGLIAAAQDASSSAAIKIYNMWTGKLLRDIPHPSLDKVNIRSLRFMEDCNGDPELWFTWSGSIVKMRIG
ncbi:hypothetical protein PMIN02_000236 [Paraphaeosphaeria minitans]